MGIAQFSFVFQDLLRVYCSSEGNRVVLRVISAVSGQVEALSEQ